MTDDLATAVRRAAPADRRVWMAGVPIDLIGESEIIALFERSVADADRIVLANVNLHGLYAALTTPAMMALLKGPDSVVHIDGTPVVWMARALNLKLPPKARNGHIDLIPKLFARCAAQDWPVVIVSGDAAAAAENARALAALAPGLRITAFDGFFDLDDDGAGSKQRRILDAIDTIKPALLLVGMGMPRQEKWIARIRGLVDVPVIMPVGGFADYFAGRTRTAPRWLGPLGFEWLYRLVHDPRRLGFRYLVEPFMLAGHLAVATARGAPWGRSRPRTKRR